MLKIKEALLIIKKFYLDFRENLRRKVQWNPFYRFYMNNRITILFIIYMQPIVIIFFIPQGYTFVCSLTIIKMLINFCNENHIFWFLNFCYIFFMKFIGPFCFVCLFYFACWIFFCNWIPYMTMRNKEHLTEDFKTFLRIRRKRWIILPILFLLLFPNVLLGQEVIVGPFLKISHSILDLIFDKKLYFENDGYYDDFLYIHILKTYRDSLSALDMAGRYKDNFYNFPLFALTSFQVSYIIDMIHYDFVHTFELFVGRNMRHTPFFKAVVRMIRFLGNWLKNKIVEIDPQFAKYVFPDISWLYQKYIKKYAIIFDEDEYEEYYKKALEKFCKSQQKEGMYIEIFNDFLEEVYDFIKDEISIYKNKKKK